MSLICRLCIQNYFPIRQKNNMEKKEVVKVKEEKIKEMPKNDEGPVEDKPDLIKTGNTGIQVKSFIFLFVINLILIGLSVFLIVNLPKKATELNTARSEVQKVIESKKIDVTGLEYAPTKEKVDKLTSYYPEEDGLIDFIESIEVLKAEGKVKNFSLVGQDAVKDKTGAYGIPFIVEFEGSWENINLSLQEFQKLPYLVRAVDIEIKLIDTKTVNFKYGGFLYVSDKLAKTR